MTRDTDPIEGVATGLAISALFWTLLAAIVRWM